MGQGRVIKNKQNKINIGGTFTPLLDAEIDSEAFKELSGSGVKVFIFFKRLNRQLQHKLGDSEPIFAYPYSRAKKAGVSESTYRRAIRDLWEKGFVSIISIGGLRGAGRTNSQYKLAGYWKTYGHQWHDRRKFESDPFSVSEPD